MDFHRRALGLGASLVAAGLVACVCACATDHSHAVQAALPSDADAVALIERRCTACHSTDRIYGSAGTSAEWEEVVHRMAYHHKAKLLTHLDDREAAQIARWLAENQPPDPTRVHIGYKDSGRPL